MGELELEKFNCYRCIKFIEDPCEDCRSPRCPLYIRMPYREGVFMMDDEGLYITRRSKV